MYTFATDSIYAEHNDNEMMATIFKTHKTRILHDVTK